MLGRRRRAPDIAGRVTSLQAALDAGGDCLDPAAVAQARAVLARTGQRLRLGADKTVIALAGATGSGKSSPFNALAGMEVSQVGVRRPTTSTATACIWADDAADELLDWLDVPRRHRIVRESVLDADRQAPLHGLILLDLPDHDSTAVAHRLEVDRLVGLVDLLVWVVDPQKYADEALHARYLRRLAGHEAVMVVVLNQVDRLTPAEVETCRSDLRRLLEADGLRSIQVFTASALRGDGVAAVRSLLADVVGKRAAVAERAAADLDSAAAALGLGIANKEASGKPLTGHAELIDALSVAAGVPVVLDAVSADYRRRAARHMGWPFTRWMARLRPDPLKRLRLGKVEEDVRHLARSSLPTPSQAQRARVDLALRSLTRQAAADLPRRWADAVRDAAGKSEADVGDALDTAVMSVDLEYPDPTWWRGVAGVHLALAAAAVSGFGWLSVLSILGWLQVPPGDAPMWGPLPVPTVLLFGGLLGGLALAWLGRWLARRGARRRRDRVDAQLREAILARAQALVLQPVSDVLGRHRAVREHLEAARQ